jgi:hypothetical protein
MEDFLTEPWPFCERAKGTQTLRPLVAMSQNYFDLGSGPSLIFSNEEHTRSLRKRDKGTLTLHPLVVIFKTIHTTFQVGTTWTQSTFTL